MQRFIRKFTNRQRRHRRIRARVRGAADRPRLSVFRSERHLAAQIIDDVAGVTLVGASDRDVGNVNAEGQHKVVVAQALGRLIAERAKAKGITKVTFDRGGYAYHGRVQALAEGARAGGLEF